MVHTKKKSFEKKMKNTQDHNENKMEIKRL